MAYSGDTTPQTAGDPEDDAGPSSEAFAGKGGEEGEEEDNDDDNDKEILAHSTYTKYPINNTAMIVRSSPPNPLL